MEIYIYICVYIYIHICVWGEGFPGGSDSKISACNVRDPGSISGTGRPPKDGHGNPLQHAFWENPMDREEPGGCSP